MAFEMISCCNSSHAVLILLNFKTVFFVLLFRVAFKQQYYIQGLMFTLYLTVWRLKAITRIFFEIRDVESVVLVRDFSCSSFPAPSFRITHARYDDVLIIIITFTALDVTVVVSFFFEAVIRGSFYFRTKV